MPRHERSNKAFSNSGDDNVSRISSQRIERKERKSHRSRGSRDSKDNSQQENLRPDVYSGNDMQRIDRDRPKTGELTPEIAPSGYVANRPLTDYTNTLRHRDMYRPSNSDKNIKISIENADRTGEGMGYSPTPGSMGRSEYGEAGGGGHSPSQENFPFNEPYPGGYNSADHMLTGIDGNRDWDYGSPEHQTNLGKLEDLNLSPSPRSPFSPGRSSQNWLDIPNTHPFTSTEQPWSPAASQFMSGPDTHQFRSPTLGSDALSVSGQSDKGKGQKSKDPLRSVSMNRTRSRGSKHSDQGRYGDNDLYSEPQRPASAVDQTERRSSSEQERTSASSDSSRDLSALMQSDVIFEKKLARRGEPRENISIERHERSERRARKEYRNSKQRERIIERADEFYGGLSDQVNEKTGMQPKSSSGSERINLYLAGGAALSLQGGSRPIDDLDFQVHQNDAKFNSFTNNARGEKQLRFINDKIIKSSRKAHRPETMSERTNNLKTADDFFPLGGPQQSTNGTIATRNWFGVKVSLSIVGSKEDNKTQEYQATGQYKETVIVNSGSSDIQALSLREIKNDKSKAMISRQKTDEASIKKVAQDLYDFLDSIYLMDQQRTGATPHEMTQHVDEAINARLNEYRDKNLETKELRLAHDTEVYNLMEARIVEVASAHTQNGPRKDKFQELLHYRPELQDYLQNLVKIPVDQESRREIRQWMEKVDFHARHNQVPSKSRTEEKNSRESRKRRSEEKTSSSNTPFSAKEYLADRKANEEYTDTLKNLEMDMQNAHIRIHSSSKQMLTTLRLLKGYRKLDLSDKLSSLLETEMQNHEFSKLDDSGILRNFKSDNVIGKIGTQGQIRASENNDETNIEQAVSMSKNQFNQAFRQLNKMGYVVWSRDEGILSLTKAGRELFEY